MLALWLCKNEEHTSVNDEKLETHDYAFFRDRSVSASEHFM
jgi:hypothetical protein